VKLNDHLYVYLWTDQRENNCNSVFIDGKMPLLIDPGVRSRTFDLFRRMTADGVNPERIKVVIGTHGHLDHAHGLVEFEDVPPYRAISLQEQRYIEEMRRTKGNEAEAFLIDPEADFYLQEGDLVLGKHSFKVLLTPGHTPGGLSIYWPRYRVLISGDIVFYQGVGRSDFPGGDPSALKQSVRRLSTLPIELLIPGHGSAIQGAERIRENFGFVERAYLS
jgi:hydroxyacylglutathione hydrolase